MKKHIVVRPPPNEALNFSETIPPILQQVYGRRRVYSDGELAYRLQGLENPAQLKGLEQAVALLLEALEQQQRILVVGDFDADGATSSALSVLALQAFGHQQVDFLVPNRFDYGYGLSPEIVEVAKQYRPELLITVDNGIASLEGVKAAKQAGIKVLVTDHHLPGEQLPEADAIINPNQHGCDFPSKHLAGVGVIFYVMSALRSALRDRQWFEKRGLAEPSMAEFLDIVALGTVADVVPLDRNNRILVHQGLQRIRAGRLRPGIAALLQIAGRDYRQLVAADFGFALGPRLNAAGRLDDMSIGIRCLLSRSFDEALALAQELDDLNRDRKAIEGGMQQEAESLLEQLDGQGSGELPWGLCLFDPRWHQGVIGILASRIKERYHRPVIAFACASEGGSELKGSARSIPGLHIRDALDAVAKRHPQLLSKFGGHAMAAGLSLQRQHFPAFQQAFDEEVRRQLQPADLQPQVLSDGELQAEDFTLALAELLRNAGPWGQHFPEPLFHGTFTLLQQRIVAQKHLKLVVALPNSNTLLDAIAFNVDVERWPAPQVQQVLLAYRLDVNEFRGQRSLQLLVEYLEAV